MSQQDQPHILVLPSGALAEEIITPRAWAVLESLGTVERNPTGRMPTAEELATWLPRANAVMTSWGTPPFDDAMLAAAPQLRIIGHAAGSIQRLTPPPVFARGIVVTHGADVIAQSVGEWALTTTLMALRTAHTFDRAMQSGQAWSGTKTRWGRELYRKRVGIIAASMTGRVFIRLLQPFDAEITVYDPYLSEERAAALGVQRAASLDELMANSDVVSNHAPTTPETDGMVGAGSSRSCRTALCSSIRPAQPPLTTRRSPASYKRAAWWPRSTYFPRSRSKTIAPCADCRTSSSAPTWPEQPSSPAPAWARRWPTSSRVSSPASRCATRSPTRCSSRWPDPGERRSADWPPPSCLTLGPFARGQEPAGQ